MHFSTFAALSAAAAVVPSVSAHGYVSGVVSGGNWYAGASPSWIYSSAKPKQAGWFAHNQDNGFVDGTVYQSGDIICHKNATTGNTYIPVAAGSTIDLQWNTWPDSHHGPVIDYLAHCPGDCTATPRENLEFFKIGGKGLIDDSTVPGKWASDELMANNNTWSLTIPKNLKPGGYVLRHEIIALHSAGSTNGAQNYPMCINLKVSGTGTDLPAGVKGTALYKNTDAGILVNIYQTLSSYTVPGPAIPAVFKTAAKRAVGFRA